MFPKILLATLTAAAAKEIDLVPISVVERTSLATEKVFGTNGEGASLKNGLLELFFRLF